MSRPIPQWKLDMLKDAELANELVIKKAEADKVAAEAAARAAEMARTGKDIFPTQSEIAVKLIR
jgi:hypothetical protein